MYTFKNKHYETPRGGNKICLCLFLRCIYSYSEEEFPKDKMYKLYPDQETKSRRFWTKWSLSLFPVPKCNYLGSIMEWSLLALLNLSYKKWSKHMGFLVDIQTSPTDFTQFYSLWIKASALRHLNTFESMS